MQELDRDISVKIIGDHIANLLDNTNDYLTADIYSKNIDVSDLIMRLKTEEEQENVDYVIVSVGAKSYFSEIEDVNYLCDLITEIFPNAEYYAIEGFLDQEESINFDEKDLKDLEEQRYKFYMEFLNNGFEVIETNDLISSEVLEPNSTNILKLKKEIDTITIGDVNLDDLGNKIQNKLPEVEKTYGEYNISDDETDFDTIYEFLERFEKIVKSKNVYSKDVTKKSYNPNVHQIEIALRFLLPNYVGKFTSDGIFDDETKRAIETYQIVADIEATGIADPDTLEEMLYDLKVQGFDEDDLGKFLKDLEIETGDVDDVYLNGRVDLGKAGLSGEQMKNVQLFLDYMIEKGITNPYTQIGILACCGKESGFVPQNEICYDTTSTSRILDIFGECRTNDWKIRADWASKYGPKVTINELKENCEDFFEAMYGKPAQPCFRFDTKNTEPGDGFKYRGRGFNGLTFKTNYKTFGDLIGEDLVSDPDKVNDVKVAAKVGVMFFTGGKTPPEFDDKYEATNYFVKLNAGNVTTFTEGFTKAREWADKFEVMP
jgi:predicted chitinase